MNRAESQPPDFAIAGRLQPSSGTERAGVARGLPEAGQLHEKVRHETRGVEREPICIPLFDREHCLASYPGAGGDFFLRAIASAVDPPCFRAFPVPVESPPEAHACGTLYSARPFPKLSNAWLFDRGVIWSEGPD
jgi:hypothetical protein